MQKELGRLTTAAKEGKLTERGDQNEFQGAYSHIVQGVNAILDAVITPLNVAANYVDRISKGDIPPKITDTYHGEFNTIKNNLNTLISAMNEVTQAAEEIAHGNLTVSGAGAVGAGQADAGPDRHGRGPHPNRDRDPQNRGRSGIGEPGYQFRLRSGVERRERPGSVGRGSLFLHGRDGFQYQAECRQRPANRKIATKSAKDAQEAASACSKRSRP